VSEGEAVLTALQEEGATGRVVALDVRDPASVEAAFDTVRRELGPVDIVINSAGIATTSPALAVTEDDWQRVIDTNLNGAWRVAQCAARMMRDTGNGGSIINIASILGMRVLQQVPAYTAAKAGLIHLTQALALEWARHGIRVNAIAPGYFSTEINADFLESEAGRRLLSRVPMGRAGNLAELDGPLLLLASDAGAFMTGSVITVDGGHLLAMG
jgi:2-deoxy-D-gluconate 3-dehydrogenase